MLGTSSYPRLYIPNQIPRQTNLDTSPATLFLSGKMHEIVLDGTNDGWFHLPVLLVLQLLIFLVYIANFAEKASVTGQHLGCVVDQLKDM